MNPQNAYADSRKNASSKGGFSLIELLVVVVVISILMVLIVPSISSMGSAGKMTTAGNLVVDTINLARQTARARNTLTMIAMVNSGTDAGRALTTLAFAATNGTNGAWSQLDRWRSIPEGIVIDPSESSDFFQSPLANAPTLTRAGVSMPTSAYVAGVFLPDGRPYTPNSSGVQVVVLKKASPGPSPENYYKIIVNQATGVPIIRRP